MAHRIEKEFAGRKLVLETGRMARQADGAVLVQYGDTVVLVTAMAERKQSRLPFFPLTVEYRSKTYAAGKFPGGFIKREGRPSDKEIVSARQIDRPLRPLFPDDYQNETQVACFIISADQENDADVLGMLGASAALTISPIPWGGPVASVRVGRVSSEWVINPTFEQLEYSDMDIVVTGTDSSIVMVEGASVEISEDDLVAALEVAHESLRELIAIQHELVEMIGGPPQKFEYPSKSVSAELEDAVRQRAASKVEEALALPNKEERNQALSALRESVTAELQEDESFAEHLDEVSTVMKRLEKETMRKQILERGERIDGRGLDDIRPISSDVGILPRTHGSALFTRGQTQALCVTTLGTIRDEQRIDSIDVREETSKSFMLHYNFPSFSVGPRTGQARDRTRNAGRAGVAAAASCVRRFPVHDPRSLRHPGVQRLELDGHRMWRVAVADGRRCPAARPVRWSGHGPGQRRRLGRHSHGHPRDRRRSRRHGLQGRGDVEGHHRDSDGHQDGWAERGHDA